MTELSHHYRRILSMHLRCYLAAVGGAAALALVPGLATAQNEAPFTIRYPPDGATVREKVHIQVPLASIPENGYVQISINGKFRAAITPTTEQRAEIRKAATTKTPLKGASTFEFVWDTKAPEKSLFSDKEIVPSDGPAEISARLYVNNAGTAGGATLKQTSSVRVTVANKITANPGPISLRYKFVDGSLRTYARTGSTVLVAGVSQGAGSSGDQELLGQSSKLEISVDDIYADGQAILRNRLMQMTVRQSGQLSIYSDNDLPGSLYEQVSPLGRVTYQNRSLSFDAFTSQGLPVSGTIDLPILPTAPVRVGDTWHTKNVPLAIPSMMPECQVQVTGSGNINTFAEAYMAGTAEELLGTFVVMKKPTVTISSKLEGLEWEGGYPTAHIVETFDGSSGPTMDGIIFGNTFIETPKINYRRDIYVAFKSGVLVKMVQKLEVSGRSPQYADTTNMGYGGGYASTMGKGSTISRGGAFGGSSGGRSNMDEDDRKGSSVFAGVGSRAGSRNSSSATTRRSGSGTSTTRRGSSSTRSGYGGSGATIGSGYSNPPALTSASGAPGTITGNAGQVMMRTTTTTEIDRGDPNQLTLTY